MSRTVAVKPLVPGMRSPVVAPLTRFLIGLPLILWPTMTNKYFAWTIVPPITAAFLGANYWASALLAWLASRETAWAYGRVAATVALLFAPLTLAATLIHIDKFHLDSFFGWAWVIAYTVYPIMLVIFLVRELRTPGGDPPRAHRLPVWIHAIYWAQALLLIPLGIGLFVAPVTVGKLWPWTLTPLTGQITGAWTLSFGVLAAQQSWENDDHRVRVAQIGYPFWVLMQAWALIRFPSDVDWGSASIWVYMAFMASCLVLGAYGWARFAARSSRPVVAAA